MFWSKSFNKDKKIRFQTAFLTDCENLFQRIYVISTTVSFDFCENVKISTRQETKQKLLMRNQPSTRRQEHESGTRVLRIATLTNNNPMTLHLFNDVDNRKRHICALIRWVKAEQFSPR